MPSKRTINRALAPAWNRYKMTWEDCTDCALCEHRRNVVFCRGQLPCEVLYIGEAPGETEDAFGTPMEGPTRPIVNGIHDDVVEAVMDHRMSTDVIDIPYAITNMVACRPLNNRDPHPDEMKACRARLHRQVLFAAGLTVGPNGHTTLPRKLLWAPKLKVIVLMGAIARDNFKLPPGFRRKPKVVDVVHPAHIVRQLRDGLDSSASLNTRRAVRAISEAYIKR